MILPAIGGRVLVATYHAAAHLCEATHVGGAREYPKAASERLPMNGDRFDLVGLRSARSGDRNQ